MKTQIPLAKESETDSAHERDKADCVVAKCGKCRRVVFASVNRPEVMDAAARREIGKMVASGCTVEHLTAEDVRKADWMCECKKRKGD